MLVSNLSGLRNNTVPSVDCLSRAPSTSLDSSSNSFSVVKNTLNSVGNYLAGSFSNINIDVKGFFNLPGNPLSGTVGKSARAVKSVLNGQNLCSPNKGIVVQPLPDLSGGTPASFIDDTLSNLEESSDFPPLPDLSGGTSTSFVDDTLSGPNEPSTFSVISDLASSLQVRVSEVSSEVHKVVSEFLDYSKDLDNSGESGSYSGDMGEIPEVVQRFNLCQVSPSITAQGVNLCLASHQSLPMQEEVSDLFSSVTTQVVNSGLASSQSLLVQEEPVDFSADFTAQVLLPTVMVVSLVASVSLGLLVWSKVGKNDSAATATKEEAQNVKAGQKERNSQSSRRQKNVHYGRSRFGHQQQMMMKSGKIFTRTPKF